MPWLLGRHKAVAAGLGGAQMAEYFPVHRECVPVDAAVSAFDPFIRSR
jgi:hypothetical protein